MSILGCDYSFSRPAPGTLVSLGVKFAGRYYSTQGNAKNLTASERDGLLSHGIDIVSVFETTAGAAGGGRAAGAAAARSAGAQAAALDQPKGTCIYYAVDYDASSSEIMPYFDGIASVDNGYSFGVYGGYYVCGGVRTKYPQAFTWQTAAWSQGHVLPGVHIYQNAHVFNGFPDIDIDVAYQDRYGSWKSSPGPANHVEPLKERVDPAMSFADGVGAGIGTDGQIYLTLDDWATDFPVKLAGNQAKFAYLPGVGLAAYRNGLEVANRFAAVVRFPNLSVHVVEIVLGNAASADGVDWAIKGGRFAGTGSIDITPVGDVTIAGKGTDKDGHIWVCQRESGVWGPWTMRAGRLL